MRISIIDRLGIGNLGAVENAGRDAARRQLEDVAIDRLIAALSRRGTPDVDSDAGAERRRTKYHKAS